MSPKITVHGGASNARDADVSPAADVSQPLVGAEADQGRPTSEEQEAVPGEALPEVSAESYGEDSAEPDAALDYDGMTLAELREEAGRRELPTYGTKAQIIERLHDDDETSSAVTE